MNHPYLHSRLPAAVFAIAALLTCALPSSPTSAAAHADPPGVQERRLPPSETQRPRIQLAILLDTSSSMDGLIDQARQQLWSAVNQFAQARRDGVSPILEVAVYEYGNSRLSAEQGYTRQVVGLTRELDQVSEALFSLTTNGGLEYCGYAIAAAVERLQWSQSQDDVRAIFIAGNEPFSQGPTPFADAIAAARARGIVVNTIHAGSYQEGINGGWQQGAILAGGNYMSIDHNRAVVHVEAPQDREIAQLNAQLNTTYIPYGNEGASSAARQMEQDSRTEEVSVGLLAQRAAAKSSALYDNAKWDLVDAVEAEPAQLEALAPTALPAPMQGMDASERREYVRAKAEERATIQSRIAELAKAREAYVAAQRRADAEAGGDTLEDALTEAVRKQAQAKRFAFDVK
ncbi:MAG TPA: hypothetical protein PKZ76_07095 [Xanthomonadaceae bacterium]|nr:hypothetical protein [Xanthomonadaceae bacterium]